MLIHDALAEYLMCPDSEIRQADLGRYIEKLSNSCGDNGLTVLQHQFLVRFKT